MQFIPIHAVYIVCAVHAVYTVCAVHAVYTVCAVQPFQKKNKK